MKLQEMLQKQQARGSKKPISPPNTLSISDYLSDPNPGRPYLGNESTPKKSFSDVPSTGIDFPAKTPVMQPDNLITKTISGMEASYVVNEPSKSKVTNAASATQKSASATQKSVSATQTATQKSVSATQTATQKSVSATQTATQKFKKSNAKVGRPKIEQFSYSKLVGNELNIINEVYHECLKTKSLETAYIEKNDFLQKVKIKSGAMRTSCARLKQKGILEDFITTKGRGSAWKFVLTENTFEQISMKNMLKLSTISDTNSNTKIHSRSSINIEKPTIQLPMAWKKIDYTQLQKVLNFFNERFGLTQIKSIFTAAGDVISAEDVQTSIENFTIGLNNYIQKPSQQGIYSRKVKIATLLECLKNGEIFIDPNVEILKKVEEKRILSERRKEMALQYLTPKFEHYFSSLSDEQAIALIPESWKTNTAWEYSVQKNDKLVQMSYAKQFAKEHFEKNIWPSILEKLLAE